MYRKGFVKGGIGSLFARVGFVLGRLKFVRNNIIVRGLGLLMLSIVGTFFILVFFVFFFLKKFF